MKDGCVTVTRISLNFYVTGEVGVFYGNQNQCKIVMLQVRCGCVTATRVSVKFVLWTARKEP